MKVNVEQTYFDVGDIEITLSFGRDFNAAGLVKDNKAWLRIMSRYNMVDGVIAPYKAVYDINYTKDEYNCKRIFDEEKNIVDVKFNHTETIKLQREFFSVENGKNRGCIEIELEGMRDDVFKKTLTTNYIHFYRIGNRIYLLKFQ